MYCKHCGKEVKEEAYVCLNCGCKIHDEKNESSMEDTGNIGWGFLGFFVPIVGLILYLLWKNDCPKNSKMAGKGALINVILSVIIFIIYLILLFLFLYAFRNGEFA